MAKQLRDKLRDRLKSDGLTMKQAAGRLGVSTTTVSEWMAGKYKGDNERIDTIVDAYLKRLERRDCAGRIRCEERFVTTTVSLDVWMSAEIAHDEGEIFVCVGSPGMGKTVSATEYTRRNPGVIMVETTPAYNTRVLISEIHRALGGDGAGMVQVCCAEIVDKLKDTERLIIVDEAENLTHKALNQLRRINDLSHVGVLLIGLPRLYENIRGRHGEYAYLHDRIGGFMRLCPINEEDAAALVNAYIPHANGLTDMIASLCKNNPRRMSKLLRRTVSASKRSGEPITEDLVREVSHMLIV